MPKSKVLLWPSQLPWKNSEVIFIHGLCVHFDIWNQIEEKKFLHFFFIFPKFIGGTLTILVIIVRVPPMNFGKMQKKNFLNFIPDIKMDQKIYYEKHFQTYLIPRVGPQ